LPPRGRRALLPLQRGPSCELAFSRGSLRP
jgi:hypothetical protein